MPSNVLAYFKSIGTFHRLNLMIKYKQICNFMFKDILSNYLNPLYDKSIVKNNKKYFEI